MLLLIWTQGFANFADEKLIAAHHAAIADGVPGENGTGALPESLQACRRTGMQRTWVLGCWFWVYLVTLPRCSWRAHPGSDKLGAPQVGKPCQCAGVS